MKNETRKQIGWEVKRSDGRRIPNYTWGMEEKREAEKAASEMVDASQPFTYRVVPAYE
jgi:hypothetical protein